MLEAQVEGSGLNSNDLQPKIVVKRIKIYY